MLRTANELRHYSIGAIDGPIGHVKDLYFDDDSWVIRYLVVDAGSWLSSRKVLITPISIRHPNRADRSLPASITKKQVRNSPDFDTDQPVSQQHERYYLGYYGYPYYWGGGGLWGNGIYPYALAPGYDGLGLDRAEREREQAAYFASEQPRQRNDDPHLRSCNAVQGYHVHAIDGEIGHVDGFLVDEDTWAIRYVIVNTSNWWLGHRALIAPMWFTAVSWSEQSVTVDMDRESIRRAPTYDSTEELNRELEIRLYAHYGRPGYWARSAALEAEL